MSHWFDRLATWSAEEREDGGEFLLTRRQAVGAATAGAGAAAGMLGSPLLAGALAENGCECFSKAQNAYNAEIKATYAKPTTPLIIYSPFQMAIYIGGFMALNAVFLADVLHCPTCDAGPSGKPPPPKAQPCTKRGGVRLRGDQCGGDVKPEPPETSCAQGTKDCGGGLCCFGDDLCCGGCCCIAPVGCGCCG
jgi:hypothetical protein